MALHYDLQFEGQDEPYDSTGMRGRPEEVRLDDGAVLPGIEIAVKSMNLGEKSEFIISPL